MEKYPNARFAFEQHKCANQFREYIWNLNRLTKSESLKFLKQFQKEFQEYYSKNILGEEFQKRYPIKDIELLINNPKVFYRKYVVSQHKLSILQHIFSIRNENNHKVLTILGIRIKFKRKKKCQKLV